MRYIFGIGLPRTGTNSLGSALHALEINGECKCVLNNYYNNRYNEKNSNADRYIIYNDSYKDVDNLLDKEKITDNKYIITTRDESDWKKSIVKFKDTNPNEYNILIKKNINQYI